MKIKRPKSKQPIPKNAKRAFKGQAFDVYQWPQKMFDGSVETFEKLKRPDIVNVIPVVGEKIILTIQEQPGTDPFLGLAGGRIDKGESPIAAVKRELLEETGYKAEKLILWEAVQLFSKIDCAIYTFIARGCKKVAGLDLDCGEKIKLKYVSFEEFLKITRQENFRDVEIALKLYKTKEKDEVKKLLFG